MATKNPIDNIYRIIQIIKIPQAKSHIQNCLSDGFRERVGVITERAMQ